MLLGTVMIIAGGHTIQARLLLPQLSHVYSFTGIQIILFCTFFFYLFRGFYSVSSWPSLTLHWICIGLSVGQSTGHIVKCSYKISDIFRITANFRSLTALNHQLQRSPVTHLLCRTAHSLCRKIKIYFKKNSSTLKKKHILSKYSHCNDSHDWLEHLSFENSGVYDTFKKCREQGGFMIPSYIFTFVLNL